ncbi:Vegetative incompatibility protein HET-E-1 [Trametes pubescens]|uniref:Vegetative incompatibility protein HET-E-1 n=1 Tax=Trametes pubescens TaxID=154538 RepID=A0A1M2V8K3_TRAPU|nr:Vegetative incompatibility protein HET-E-1 [Trametes pubescens]
MPRFLDTATGEFRWIADPSNAVYAILSHTWRSEEEGGEQTYNQVRKIWKRMRKSRVSGEITGSTTSNEESILSHPDLSGKIKAICKVAREAGYKLVWIDCACIDKSSSAELAETINSMFDLYRLADVCYIYLVDVPESREDPEHYTSAFQQSRWHGRGWTLQELLAPKEVVFLTASWTFLGTKCSLVHTLTLATNIDSGILLGRDHLSSASVARRMSWAARRETTRVEDEAYSLLGIFRVHLSPIYGEGRNAFLRLQEEIMKTIPDQSIFAWGAQCVLSSIDAAEMYSNFLDDNTPTGLIVSSPRQFSSAEHIQALSPSDFLSRLVGDIDSGLASSSLELPSLHSVITPEGVRLKGLTIDLTELAQIAAAIISNIENSPDNHLLAEDYEHCLSLG